MYIDGNKILKSVESKFNILKINVKKIYIFQFFPNDNTINRCHLSASISTIEKKKVFERVGIDVVVHTLKENTSISEFNKIINHVVDDKMTGGVIVQVPIPIKLSKCLLNIPGKLDIDNIGGNSNHFLCSATAETAFRVIEYFINKNDKVLINGYGFIGKGIGKYLNKNNIKFDTTDFNKKEIIVKNYNIVISCSGNPEIIKKGCSKFQKLIIDIGFSPIVDRKTNDIFIYGDVHHSMHKNVEVMSPVPGGMGPLEMAMILERIAKLWFYNKNLWGADDVKQSLREISPNELYVKRCRYKFNKLFKNVEFLNNI